MGVVPFLRGVPGFIRVGCVGEASREATSLSSPLPRGGPAKRRRRAQVGGVYKFVPVFNTKTEIINWSQNQKNSHHRRHLSYRE